MDQHPSVNNLYLSERLQKTLAQQLAELEGNPPASAEEADAKADEVQKLLDALSRYEQELNKMHKDAETRDRQQRDIRVRAARTKAEYDQLKTE